MFVVQRDVLYIYNVLFKLIYKYGYIYVFLWKLKGRNLYNVFFIFEVYYVINWEESLKFFREINAVKIFGNFYSEGCFVFLLYIFRYE